MSEDCVVYYNVNNTLLVLTLNSPFLGVRCMSLSRLLSLLRPARQGRYAVSRCR